MSQAVRLETMETAFFIVSWIVVLGIISMLTVRGRENLLLLMWVAVAIPAVVAVGRLLIGP